MKNTLLLFVLFLFPSCKGYTIEKDFSEFVNYSDQITEIKSDSLLKDVQNKIYNSFVQSLLSKDNKPLRELSLKLKELYNEKELNLILYWRSYLQFYSSIYFSEMQEKNMSEKEIDIGINWLKNMKGKNSEDFALLSMLQGYSMQFKGTKVMFISINLKKNIKKAIALDSVNPRAYYVYASNDFYTPEKYGGGSEAEEYLLKAISLTAQKIKNEYLPSWGKEEAYEMLIKLYIKTQKWDLAKEYFEKGIREFPKSYSISLLASELVGK